ncbi:addiction module toxin RelE [Caulobacter radicis]|uniref:type II toxin-antitoxin system RelE/ParE family toxin n=1 Tax=Caulobacter radicis TaxID=2172650 RepID=UPI000D56A91B|nr:type II toxin-antitoxin system RelE/ParE family toxin [Caulobacter radicis]PVM86113.1 addiction module toxin RelE [Caulobacter radicis]
MPDRDTSVFNVVWSVRSRRDLEGIRAYVGQVRPIAAQRLALRLIAAVEALAEHPHRGRPVGEARELVVIAPYVVRYRVKGAIVEIIRIKHGAERPD